MPTKSSITLSLHRNSADPTALFLRISLRSVNRPHLLSQRDVKIYDGQAIRSKQLLKEISITAGALAEYQCEHYGDPHNPDQCAKEALDAYEEIIARLEEANVKKKHLNVQESLNVH